MIKDLAESGKPFVDAEGNPIRSDAAYHPERLKNNETKDKLFILNDIAAAMYDREDEILNYFVNRSTNASAESLNAKIKDFCLLTHQMFDGCNWMVDNHSWPRPSHYHSDTLFHLWSIAMHRTFLAGGLLLAKTASVESAVGIVQQFLATWA